MSQATAASPADAPRPAAAPVDAPRPAAAPVDAPRPAAAPVVQAERIAIIDVVRGVALLGILLMNIPFFAMPERFNEPWRADTGSIDFWVHTVNTVLFEGKMRALFSAVFGAGIVLFTLGKERAGRPATGLFYRRMLWLTLFGLAHAHLLLWVGDVLYFYGLIGMLAYLLRRIPPRRLALGVPLVAVVGFTAHVFFYQHMRAKRLAWREAVTAQAEGRALTPAHESALVAWREMEKDFLPNREEIAQHTALMKGSYGEAASFVRVKAAEGQFKYLLLGLWDMLALMLLGIALYHWGFLTLQWSNRAYKRTAAIGYAVGLPAVIFSHAYMVIKFPTLEAMLAGLERVSVPWTGALYDLQRIALMMAHVSVLMLVYRAGWLQGLFARLRAVGQMAFTHYILQTVICSLVFFGYGLNQFAEWRYHQLYALVAAIWVLQLAVSPAWLRAFHFGPLEWLWRTLTYWKPQPFVRREPVAAVEAPAAG